MWGNSTGWIISIFVAFAMGGLLYKVAAPPPRTEAINSAQLAVANKEIVLPVPADAVVAPGKSDSDAGDLYRKAMSAYEQSASKYDKFNDQPMKVPESDLGGIQEVLSARDCRNCTLFSKDLAKVVNYDNTEPALDALYDIGKACCTIGLLYTNKDYNANLQPERAIKLWEAAFVLGVHLYDERESWAEYIAGHKLMQMAATNLATYYRGNNEAAKADKIQSFMEAENSQETKLYDASKVICQVDENYAGKYAGDIFMIAENPAADKMFRAEALKHIGHYRFNALVAGDQLAARRVIKKAIADEKSPANVKAAATAAHDLTIEQHRGAGGGA